MNGVSFMTIRVLLADDHNLVLEGLIQLLEKEDDIEILSAVSNPLLLDKEICTHSPDIIILDVRFESHNGIEITQRIMETYPTIKVIILSGFNYQEYIQAASKAGAYSFLSKDKTNSELIYLIRKVASGIKYFPNIQGMSFNDSLSKRERTILALIAKDYSNIKISEELKISKRTVEYHISSIINKLNVDTRVGAVVKGIKKGYLDL